MKRSALFFCLGIGMVVSLPGPLQAAAWTTTRPAFHNEFGDSWRELEAGWGQFAEGLRDWSRQWRQHFNARGFQEERPLISFMLRHREKLGLSIEQIRSLEQLRTEFQRNAIRTEADLRIAEMDLAAMLQTEPIDMKNVEAKVREAERLQSELRLDRIRTIKKGKEELSADQRKKLQELMAQPQLSRLQSWPSR